VVAEVVVTVTLVVLLSAPDPRVLVTTNEPLATDATAPNAVFANPNPAPPRGLPLGRAEGRNDGRALGSAPKPALPRAQLPEVAVMTTFVAIKAVTGARVGRALGRALGRLPVEAAVAVTQSPTLSAAADVVTVWLNLVEELKLTVVCDCDWSFSMKMLVGLTALMFPVVPGRELAAPLGRGAGAPAVVPVAADFPLLPQAADSTRKPSATAGTRNARKR
jgi:hypothetical protein